MAASIQEIQATIGMAVDLLTESQGPIDRAIADAERARAALMASLDGTNQPDVESAIAALTAWIEHLRDALGQSHRAISLTQQIGQRL